MSAVSGDVGSNSRTTAELEAIHSGKRQVFILGLPFDAGLAAPTNKGDEDNVIDQRLSDYQQNIKILNARLLADNEGRLCLIQRIHISRISEGLSILNDALSRRLVAIMPGANRDPYLCQDPTTLSRIDAKSKDGSAWVEIDDDSLVFRLPLTPEVAAASIRKLLVPSSEPGSAALRDALQSLSAVLIDKQETRLYFSPEADGWIEFAFHVVRQAYRPDVANKLTRLGEIDTGELAAEIRALKQQ